METKVLLWNTDALAASVVSGMVIPCAGVQNNTSSRPIGKYLYFIRLFARKDINVYEKS